MQKNNPNGSDPNRFPKDLLILMLSYAAEHTFRIAPVCKMWSEIVKLQPYWHRFVQKRLRKILHGLIDDERFKAIDIFINPPYDMEVKEIPFLTMRQRLGWMFNCHIVSFAMVAHKQGYNHFHFRDTQFLGMRGLGMRWVWHETHHNDFAVEFGFFGDDGYHQDSCKQHFSWFPLHPTLNKRFWVSRSFKNDYYELWEPVSKRFWRGPVKFQSKSLIPDEGNEYSHGKWYSMEDFVKEYPPGSIPEKIQRQISGWL